MIELQITKRTEYVYANNTRIKLVEWDVYELGLCDKNGNRSATIDISDKIQNVIMYNSGLCDFNYEYSDFRDIPYLLF